MNNFSKNQVNFYTVTEKDENQRLDNLLVKILKGVPKSHVYRIIRSGEIRVNKKRYTANDKLVIGDLIRIPPIQTKSVTPNFVPSNTFPILFEDDYFLIIDKPDGVACHGGSGVSFGIIEQLRKSYPNAKFLELAHRLDKETSGILILAKKRSALVGIQDLIKNNQVKKHYLALTNGVWDSTTKNVKQPLFKYLTKDGERRVRVDRENGQFSQTIFKVITKYKNYTLVKAELKTGRTHQIRVHLQCSGYPILGDVKYGDFELNKELIKTGFKRMFLHAFHLEFIHPITDQIITIESQLPKELKVFVDGLE